MSFSFPKIGCRNKIKEPSLPYYLPTAREKEYFDSYLLQKD